MKSHLLLYFVLIISAAAVVLLAAFYIKFWPLELLVSFAPQLMVLLFIGWIVCLGLGLATHSLKAQSLLVGGLVLVLLCSCYNLYKVCTAESVSTPVKTAARTINFTTFNKEFSNHDLRRISDYMKQQQVDVLALQETNPSVTKQISQQTHLSHFYMANKLTMVKGTGAALLSRYPISQMQTFDLPSGHSSLIRAVISLPESKPIAFYSVHISGPFSPNRYQAGKIDSQAVANQLQKEALPYILGGDFNKTPYSPVLQSFNRQVSGKSPEIVTERPAKYSRYGSFPLLGIRIDHIYLPKTARLTQSYISAPLGSDHRAVTVKFTL